MPSGGIRTHDLSRRVAPQTYALDCAVTPFKYIKQYKFCSSEFCIMQTYFNMIVLALEGFPSFLSTSASYLHSQPSELGFPKQETTLEIIFFLQ
jgi:hypothetical protein